MERVKLRLPITRKLATVGLPADFSGM